MADTKISALTAATTPLAGTEVLPIVQSGVTKQVSVANLTAGRAVSALSMTLTNALAIASGGTNSTSTPTAGAVIYGSGSAYAVSAAGTAGQVLVSGGSGAPTWTGGPTFTATTKVNMTEAYFGLDAGTLGTGKLWYLISGGGGNVTSGYFSIWNGTNGNKVFSIAPSTSEQFTTDTSGNFNMVAGNVVQGTAAKGFNFTANTGAAGKTSQLLNWYEEGTWTPSLGVNGFSGAPSVSSVAGTYTRVGRQVTVNFRLSLSSGAYPSTYCVITGLPFTPATPEGVGEYTGANPGSGVQGGAAQVNTSAQVVFWPSTGTTTSSAWFCTVTYFV